MFGASNFFIAIFFRVLPTSPNASRGRNLCPKLRIIDVTGCKQTRGIRSGLKRMCTILDKNVPV